jgi:hypothetical protein
MRFSGLNPKVKGLQALGLSLKRRLGVSLTGARLSEPIAWFRTHETKVPAADFESGADIRPFMWTA